ncbi:MAG: TolB protein [Ilumatobacteraceae bacterium]
MNERRRWLVPLVAAAIVAVASVAISLVNLHREGSAATDTSRPTTTTAPVEEIQTGLIAFVDAGDANAESWDLYVVGADGTSPQRVGIPSGFNSAPEWSPDGQRLAYVRDGSELVVIDWPSGEEVLTALIPSSNGGIGSNLEWSPDGSLILVRAAWFDQSSGHPFASLIFDLNGPTWHRIIERTIGVPHWSPDGNWLLVPAGDLYLVPVELIRSADWSIDSEHPGVRRLPTGSQDTVTTSWAPDSASFATVSDANLPKTRQGRIDRVLIADGSTRTVVDGGYSPSWSPTGAQIAYLRDRTPPHQGADVWVVSPDGADDHRVGTSFIPPRWSPDGTLIAMVDEGGLFAVRPDGSGEVRLSAPDLAPSSFAVNWLRDVETFDFGTGRGGDFAPSWQSIRN